MRPYQEDLIDIVPRGRTSGWGSTQADEATVVERIALASGGTVLIAAS